MREEFEAPSVGRSIVLMPHVAYPYEVFRIRHPALVLRVCYVFFDEDAFIIWGWEIFISVP